MQLFPNSNESLHKELIYKSNYVIEGKINHHKKFKMQDLSICFTSWNLEASNLIQASYQSPQNFHIYLHFPIIILNSWSSLACYFSSQATTLLILWRKLLLDRLVTYRELETHKVRLYKFSRTMHNFLALAQSSTSNIPWFPFAPYISLLKRRIFITKPLNTSFILLRGIQHQISGVPFMNDMPFMNFLEMQCWSASVFWDLKIWEGKRPKIAKILLAFGSSKIWKEVILSLEPVKTGSLRIVREALLIC